MSFIKLTGHYPKQHSVYLSTHHVVGILENVINENSVGSTVYAGEGAFQVREEPQEILTLIQKSEPLS
jgi:hypothetical protein